MAVQSVETGMVSADGALYGDGTDAPELEHLAWRRANGVFAGLVGRRTKRSPLDYDRDTDQRHALLISHLAGNCPLLRKSLRSTKEYSHHQHDYSCFHNDVYRVLVDTSRSSRRPLERKGADVIGPRWMGLWERSV